MTSNDEGTSLASSFTDMMTSLAVIFVLLLVVSLNSVHEGTKDTVQQILARLKKELHLFSRDGVEIRTDPRDPLALLVIVPEGLLNFNLDEAQIPDEGSLFLQNFVPRLATTLSGREFNEKISSVVVEGHTDSSGTEEHNVELSQKRSLAVALESMHILAVVDPQVRNQFVPLLSATGRGESDLIRSADGTENASSSRRVVFKIRVRSLEQRTLREILNAAQK